MRRSRFLFALSGIQACAAASKFWYENIKHNGISASIPNGNNWTVFRNVKDYGAKGDGTTDDTAAIQRAITTGNSASTRETGRFGSTGQPAVVYFPVGTYLVKATIRSAVGTLLMGDPLDKPTIKASADFAGAQLLFGRDKQFTGLVGFYHGVKGLVLDSTAVARTKAITLLEWSVSQNNILSDVVFRMPVGADGHTGIATTGLNSGLIMNELVFEGGGTGISLAATQYHLKNLVFNNVKTGVKFMNLLQATAQGLRFSSCSVGIDATVATMGMLNLIDSTATNTSALVTAGALSAGAVSGSLMLENIRVDGSTVRVSGTAVLTGSVEPGVSWIRGNVYKAGSTSPQLLTGQRVPTSRPDRLVNGTGFYYTIAQPTYSEYDVTQVINVKDVAQHPVAGDGVTDDTASLQAIVNAAAEKSNLVYFPHGIYLLSDTLFIPTGSRLVGEAWTQLSATGTRFANASRPHPMIQIGRPGDVGLAQLSDFVFTVADILPGAVLVEVNMAGPKPGDVALFNCHYRVGGARGSKTQTACANPQTCLAARLSLHLTQHSSAYIENSWSWTADHDLDGGSGTVYPGTAGGFLIEAQNGTWILGSGIEHHVLYQVNIRNAKNVFIGLQEGESAYWQGTGNKLLAPEPWSKSLLASDPDFGWCAVDSAMCRMGLYQIVTSSTNLNLYSSGFWNFVGGPTRAMCTADCQENAALYEGNSRMHVYGFSTINSKNLILERSVSASGGKGDVSVAAPRTANAGAVFDGLFKTGVVAAYLKMSG
ncbi:glycoside hydrolase family 55 protein [Schizothecium vesticola]|uniref:Glycoside hydrolase family 55 protein n=1 Tax=Schizothecium vesticola TaxID=314040 RepID=A0AA40K873_9PEZI|nr:glycoside hydrolase family 55 protein [Schizothecium vesticola]